MLHHMGRAASYARIYRYVSSTYNGTAATTYTFSGQSLGEASLRRRIVVAVTGTRSTASTVTSVTIGGTTATLVAGPSRNTASAFAYLDQNSSTTGDVVVTFGATRDNCTIAVYNLINLKNAAEIGSAFPAGATASTISTGNFSVSAGGFVIVQLNKGNNDAVTWTNVQQDVALNPASLAGRVYASTTNSTTTATFSATASWTNSIGVQISAISFA
jgi:hypothetical protein